MFIRYLAALRKSSKKKETEIEKDIVEVYKGYDKGYRKKAQKYKIGMMNFLTLHL